MFGPFSWTVVVLILIFLIVTLVFASIGLWKGGEDADIFRDLLTIILAIAGVGIAAGGYLVYRVLEGIIERRAEHIYSDMRLADEAERFRSMAGERIHSGYTYWLFYKNTNQFSFLEQAITETERAYSRYAVNLDEGERPNQLVICAIRNNLAYYYAERQRPEDKKLARDYAEYINNKISIFPESRETWEDTYNFVLERYP